MPQLIESLHIRSKIKLPEVYSDYQFFTASNKAKLKLSVGAESVFLIQVKNTFS